MEKSLQDSVERSAHGYRLIREGFYSARRWLWNTWRKLTTFLLNWGTQDQAELSSSGMASYKEGLPDPGVIPQIKMPVPVTNTWYLS